MKAYQMKITLKEVKPAVWREIIVPASIDFEQLHTAIQIAMGWLDYHLYEFSFIDANLRITNNEEAYEEYVYFTTPEGKNKLKELQKGGMPFDFSTEVRLPEETKIEGYVEQYKKFIYTYDFGDGWEHEIKVQKIIEDYTGHPKVLNYEGNCPPEDCGGAYGYQEFLEAWNDPDHPEHESMREWGEDQEYGEYDKEYASGELEAELED